MDRLAERSSQLPVPVTLQWGAPLQPSRWDELVRAVNRVLRPEKAVG